MKYNERKNMCIIFFFFNGYLSVRKIDAEEFVIVAGRGSVLLVRRRRRAERLRLARADGIGSREDGRDGAASRGPATRQQVVEQRRAPGANVGVERGDGEDAQPVQSVLGASRYVRQKALFCDDSDTQNSVDFFISITWLIFAPIII